MSRWEFWIDRGGTFTDVIGRAADNSLHTLKLLSENSTHYDDAAIEGMRRLLDLKEGEPITEAIIAFSRLNGSDPEQTLVEAFPAIQRLINDGLLVLADSDARNVIEASFSTGSEFIADGGLLLGPVPQQEHATS